MIPFCLVLAGIGLLPIGSDPKHPNTSTHRRQSLQSVYSVHNYKQPQSAAVAQRNATESGIVVSTGTAQSVHYKQQRPIEQPTGSVTLSQRATVHSSKGNYKNQQPIKSVDKPQASTAGN